MLKAFQMLQVGFCVADSEGGILEADEAYIELLGLGGIPVQQVNYRTLTHPDDIPQVSNMQARVLSTGMPQVFRKRSLRGNGEVFWVENRLSILRGALDPRVLVASRPLEEVSGVVSSAADIASGPVHLAAYVCNLGQGLSRIAQEAELAIASEVFELASKVAAIELELKCGRRILQ